MLAKPEIAGLDVAASRPRFHKSIVTNHTEGKTSWFYLCAVPPPTPPWLFRGFWSGRHGERTPPGRLIVSWGEANTCEASGHSGRVSPGAPAMMKVRLRDWATPKLPAFNTPNRTCNPQTPLMPMHTCIGCDSKHQLSPSVVLGGSGGLFCISETAMYVESYEEGQGGSRCGWRGHHLVAHVQQGSEGEAEGEGLVVAHEVAHVFQQEEPRSVEVRIRQVRHHLPHATKPLC